MSDTRAIANFVKLAHLRNCGGNLVTDCGEDCGYEKDMAFHQLAVITQENDALRSQLAASEKALAEAKARLKTPDALDAITYFEKWEPIYGDPRGDKLEAVKQATEDARQYFGFEQRQ